MMLNHETKTALFDGHETWEQLGANVDQMRVLFSHDWLRIEENARRWKTKYIFEGNKRGVSRMENALRVHGDAVNAREIEGEGLSNAVLRKKITFLAERLLHKGVISINALSWDG